jgi:arsenite methyltransferase
VRITAPGRLAAGVDLNAAAPVLSAARDAVADGTPGYALLVAGRPR